MRVKDFVLSGLFLFVALAFAACGEDKTAINTGWDSGALTVKDEVLLSGSNTQSLNIKATSKPTLTSDAEWLKIGEVKNLTTGIYTVELTAEPNVTGDTRTAKVTVVAGKETATITVTQVSGDLVEIRSIDPQGDLDPNGGTLTIKYVATGTPATNLPEWISVSGTRSLVDGELKLTYTPNNTGKEREGMIVLAVGKDGLANVTVRQPARTVAALSGRNAKQIAADMYAGVNIGNTMECPGKEGDWSMPVNEAYVAALAGMGFNAVRIPCAWDSHAADGVIDSAWLDRVDEVVGWVIGNGMYALLNIHWDGGWLENTLKDGYDAAVDAKQSSYWTQIAEKLGHYDQHLLFAAMNEPNVGDGAAKKKASIEAIMKYQKTMIDAVRATGGNNLDRVLVMQVPNTDIEIAAEGQYAMPADQVADRLMVEAHFYGPYNFNMMEKDESWGKYAWYWGKENFVEGSDRNSTWGDEAWVKEQFQTMKRLYVDKGIPGITGEYAVCAIRENDPGIDKDRWKASVRLWNKVVTMESKNAGMVPFFWEIGQDINRTNGSVLRSYQLDGVFEGAALGKYPF